MRFCTIILLFWSLLQNLLHERKSASRINGLLKCEWGFFPIDAQTQLVLKPLDFGSFFHFAPLSRIQKMPAKACRLETGGRPPFGLG
jgi:hypothetical protein